MSLAQWPFMDQFPSCRLEPSEQSVAAPQGAGSVHLPPPQSELDLAMARYVEGDLPAFSSVYRLIAPRLYGYLMRKTANPERTEDLIQQTMLQIHRARSSFARGADPLPWVFTIARRLLIDSVRNKRRQRALLLQASEVFTMVRSKSSPDEMILARQAAARVAVGLSRLPQQQRIAFKLLREQQLSLAEAAATLNVTRNVMKVRLHRAQSALRTALADDEV